MQYRDASRSGVFDTIRHITTYYDDDTGAALREEVAGKEVVEHMLGLCDELLRHTQDEKLVESGFAVLSQALECG